MIPLKTIEDLISKHSLLEKELSSGKVEKKLFAEKSKEYSDLNEVIDDIKKYFSYHKYFITYFSFTNSPIHTIYGSFSSKRLPITRVSIFWFSSTLLKRLSL